MALPLSVQMSRLCFDVGGEIKTYRNFTIEKLEYARITDARVHRQYLFFFFLFISCVVENVANRTDNEQHTTTTTDRYRKL